MWPFRRCHCFLYALLSNGCRFRIWNSKRWMWIWCIFLSWSPKSGSFVWMMSHSSVEPTNGNSVVGVVNSRPSISRWLQLKSAGSEHEPVMSLRSSKIRSTLKRVGAFAVKTARAGNREGDSTGGGTAVLFCTVNRRTVPNVGLSEVPTKLLFMMICVPAALGEVDQDVGALGDAKLDMRHDLRRRQIPAIRTDDRKRHDRVAVAGVNELKVPELSVRGCQHPEPVLLALDVQVGPGDAVDQDRVGALVVRPVSDVRRRVCSSVQAASARGKIHLAVGKEGPREDSQRDLELASRQRRARLVE